ncbi:hypothetical protein V8B97DRAFT_1919431 [Scleroderma yunnanense]
MPPRKVLSNLFKVGPPRDVKKSQKVKTTASPTKVYQHVMQSYTIKLSNILEPFSTVPSRNHDTSSQPNNQPQLDNEECSMMCNIVGTTEEEHKEEYLNSFCPKMVTLQSGKQLYPQVAPNQLCTGAFWGRTYSVIVMVKKQPHLSAI